MPGWGRRGSYVAVTSTVAALVAIGIVSECGRQAIPPPEPNDLAGFRSRFLKRAEHQGIRWRITEDKPFSEAARLGKPVMVFAGTAASLAARTTDDAVFGNPEVWARLNRDFVCVRVDLAVEPEWRGALLPELRNRIGTDPGFTIWFFKPNGQLLTWIGRRDWASSPDYNDFLGRLSEIKQQFSDLPPDAWSQSESEQHEEVEKLRHTASRSLPDMDAFFGSLSAPPLFFTWQAGRYRSLLQAGLFADARTLLRRDLCTPRADLVDGGFFRIASGASAALVEFDKSAAANAEMLVVLARAFLATNDPLFEYWYRRTAECVQNQFMVDEAWSSFLENAVAEDGRSFRNSFSVAAVRTRLDESARGYTDTLGLDPRTNPLMAPYLTEPEKAMKDWPALDAVIGQLQKAGDASRVVPSKDGALDSAALVVARSLEAAMLMDDTDLLSASLSWAFELRAYRAGTDEVVHALFGRGLGRKWLGDFAAYADAMMQLYVATGEARWLRDGERVLRRAIELFSHGDQGDVVAIAGPNAKVGPLSLEMPSIVDDVAPPALPLFMSVCHRYGAVIGDPGLRSLAVAVSERFASAANAQPASYSAYFFAAQEVSHTGCVVVKDREQTRALARAHPEICILPASEENSDVGETPVRYLRGEPSAWAP